MSFDASAISPETAFNRMSDLMKGSRRHLLDQRDVFTQPTVSSYAALALMLHFRDIIVRMDIAVTVPGLDAYAKSIKGAAYDIAAEWNGVKLAMNDATAQILALIPSDGNGFRLILKLLVDGTQDWRTFTAAQAAPIVTKIDAVVAAITDNGQNLL